jgi:hypothetical protein
MDQLDNKDKIRSSYLLLNPTSKFFDNAVNRSSIFIHPEFVNDLNELGKMHYQFFTDAINSKTYSVLFGDKSGLVVFDVMYVKNKQIVISDGKPKIGNLDVISHEKRLVALNSEEIQKEKPKNLCTSLIVFLTEPSYEITKEELEREIPNEFKKLDSEMEEKTMKFYAMTMSHSVYKIYCKIQKHI